MSRDFAAFHAAGAPDRVAIVELATGSRWDYRALNERIARCAAVFVRRGVRPGDRVAMLARNCFEIVVVQLACSRLGAMFVVLNWRLAAAELAEIVADAEPVLLIHDAFCSALANSAGAGADCLDKAHLNTAMDAFAGSSACLIEPDVPALMLYTSGTTGRPKGVVLSERNAACAGLNLSLTAQIERSSVLLCEAPMFHVFALVIALRASLQQGATFVIGDGFDPVVANRRLSDPALAVSHYFCVPQMAAAVRAVPGFDPAALSTLTAIVAGGAPSDPADVLAWLEDGIPFLNGYGMTEVGSATGMPLDPSSIRARPGSVGLIPPTQEIRVMDAAGHPLPDGSSGEVWIRGPNVCRGYWKRPDETAAAFTEDGWFKTGDIGVIDSLSYLTLIDRKKEMFISGGENVYPREIELALLAHSHVRDAAVIGVPDSRWGEVGCAFVVPAAGTSPDTEKLRAHCSARLARYKLPKHFVMVDDLPRSGAGKVLKQALRDGLVTGSLSPPN